MIQFIASLYLTKRTYYGVILAVLLFLTSYWLESFWFFAWLSIGVVVFFVCIEVIYLYRANLFVAERILPEKFSNSDANNVSIEFINRYPFSVIVECIDEIPIQFQKRDFLLQLKLASKQKEIKTYQLIPVERGAYFFGKLNCYVSSPIQLIKRRFVFGENQEVKVYPSFIQMKEFDYMSEHKMSLFGFKKVRRIGHTLEFEQIKEYVKGDDIRTLNWKATAKHRRLMVNQYQDEKSQPVYSFIDSGRSMMMPFNGLSLLDYAVNSSLAFSNIALKKGDKVGLLEFSHQIGKFAKANARKSYLINLMEALYNIKTDFLTSDFGKVYVHTQRQLSQRSLILFYTNFEHLEAMRRQLPYLKAMARKHLLVVIFFENTELQKLIEKPANSIYEVTEKTIAKDLQYEKRLMVEELKNNGIRSLLTKPEELSMNTINTYLSIKSKGIL